MFNFIENGVYQVRDLINVPIDQMRSSPEAAKITLIFDDGELTSSSRECIHGRFCWESYRIYPEIFVSKQHHLGGHKRNASPGITAEILNTIRIDCTEHCISKGLTPPSLEKRCEIIYEVTDMFDGLYRDISRYSLTLDSVGLVEILHDPDMEKYNQEIEQASILTHQDISRGYEIAHRLVVKSTKYQKTQIGKYSRFGGIKLPQFYKFVAPLGFVTDLDNFLIRSPIRSSLMAGLTSIRELLIEARTASLSLSNQKGAIQKSEYLTRQLQLDTASVFRTHRNTDCGSQKYHVDLINKRSDLNHYRGTYYLDPESQTLKVMRGNEYHLLNQVVTFRTILGCQLGDRYGFCSTCFGKMIDQMFDNDNIGHQSASTFQEIVTQLILSTKHHMASALGESIQFGGRELDFIHAKSADPFVFYFNGTLKSKRVCVTFDSADAKRLPEIEYNLDLEKVSPLRLSKLNEIVFRVYEDDMLMDEIPVKVSTKSQKGYFTKEMLNHIKQYGWSIDAKGFYEVSLEHWNFTKPAIGLPMVQFSTPAHMEAIKEMLTTKESKNGALSKYVDVYEALPAFQQLVRQKLEVNFIHLQVILATYLTTDPDNYDFRLPKDKTLGVLTPYRDVFTLRDFSLAMAFERQLDVFKDVRSYVVKHRPPHPHSNALRG